MPTDKDWARLGDLLTRRRIDLDPRYGNRVVFAREKQIRYRLLVDVEKHTRQNFEPGTKALFEHAYELKVGAIDRVLAGAGQLDALDPAAEETAAGERERDLLLQRFIDAWPGFSEDQRELLEGMLDRLEQQQAGRRYGT